MRATKTGKRSKGKPAADESGVHFDEAGPTYREPIPPDDIVRMKDELLDLQVALDALLVESEHAQATAKVAAKLWKARIDVKRREVSVLAAEVKSGHRDRPRQQEIGLRQPPYTVADLPKPPDGVVVLGDFLTPEQEADLGEEGAPF